MGQNDAAPHTGVPATSGIQVLDRALYILTIIAEQPRSLTELCDITGLPRATAHRIAVALEKHRLIERLPEATWGAGPALSELAPSAGSRLEDAAEQILPVLMRQTGESVQLYRMSGMERLCIATAEPSAGLRDTVPVGTRMTLAAGSAAKVLVAYSPEAFQQEVLTSATYTVEDLQQVYTEGIAESIAERDASLASASVPIFTDGSAVPLGVLSISGPVARMGDSPKVKFGDALRTSARSIQDLLEA